MAGVTAAGTLLVCFCVMSSSQRRRVKRGLEEVYNLDDLKRVGPNTTTISFFNNRSFGDDEARRVAQAMQHTPRFVLPFKAMSSR